MPQHHKDGFHPDAMSVHESEMLVATADASDELINSAVSETLLLLRERLAMDVVFVSEFVDGHRVTRPDDGPKGAAAQSGSNSSPLEEAWGQTILDGRLPKTSKDIRKHTGSAITPAASVELGAYLSAPVLLANGVSYGTLCCFSDAANTHLRERDLRNLQSVAQLIAAKIEKSPGPEQTPHLATEPSPLTLQPKW
jgi:GAF domain-containing protein